MNTKHNIMDSSKHTEKLVDSLQEILQKNYDAEKGLKEVMLKAESQHLKKWLQKKAVERSGFANEIDGELRKLGAEPKESGSFTGDMHRVWIDVKTALSSHKDEAIFEECIRGDKASVDEYNKQLKEPFMTGAVVPILTKQKAKVEEALMQFKHLEDLAN